jgi:acyl-CoA synthetase (NDP forming)
VAPPGLDGGRRSRAESLFRELREEGRRNLLESEAREILALYGIPLPPARMARTPEEAAALAGELAFPLALKIVSPDIVHKTEVGGVRLNLQSPQEAEEAARAVLENGLKQTTRERVMGFLLSPMAPAGQECIFGLVRDPQFGPVVLFGLGGIFVEILEDVAFGVAPLTARDVERMILSIKGYRLLQGVRGEPPKDLDTARDLLARLSLLGVENPEVAELDLNPVFLHPKGGSVVDARIILSQ